MFLNSAPSFGLGAEQIRVYILRHVKDLDWKSHRSDGNELTETGGHNSIGRGVIVSIVPYTSLQ